MKLKSTLALVLGLILLVSFGACSYELPLAPSTEQLQGMSDEETVTYLLSNFKGLDLPAVSYEMKAEYTLADTVVLLTAQVARKGDNLSVATQTSVGDVSVPYSFTYVGGILYAEALGVKVKGPAALTEAEAALQQQLPFTAENLGMFGQKTLLRSEDGSCHVVLSDPTVDVTGLLNLSAVAKDSEDVPETEDPSVETGIRFTKTTDFYVSLSFSPSSVLQKMTVGGDVTVLDNGVELQMKMEVTYRILSTDPAQISVAAPADADQYQQAETDTESSEDSEKE